MSKISPKRGKREIRKLLYKVFSFTFHKLIIKGRQQKLKYWRCEKRKRSCKARIWTDLKNKVITNKCANVHHTCHYNQRQCNRESTASKSMIIYFP